MLIFVYIPIEDRTLPKTPKDPFALKMKKVRDHKGRIKHVPEGVDVEKAVDLVNPRAKYSCTPANQKKVAELYVTLGTFKAVAEQLKISPSIIYSWIQDVPSFKHAIAGALVAKGFMSADKAIEEAELADEDNVHAQRLKVETHKWVAENCHPEVFGKKTKISGDPLAPLTFIIDTGISRNPEPQEVPQIKQEK